MKTLTISIAAYNAENYIGKALGLLTESGCLHDLQVIVVDDGSTDLTANIARRYSDENPDSIQLISKENGGYGSTINCSIKHADGKYYQEDKLYK